MIKIALAGVGYWGSNLLRVLAELKDAKIEYVCDSNQERLKQCQAIYPSIKFIQDFNQAVRGRNVDAVVIATPAFTHFELAKNALEKNKDVFVEKPLAMDTTQAEELIKLAEDKKRIIMVGHILQYHPAIIKLKELISKGELGKIQYVYSRRLNIGKLRVEEDIIWSFAPHDTSVILMLLDDEPVKVSTFGGDYLSRDIYDTTLTNLEFKNGVKGHIFVSWLHPYKEQKLVVVGSKAMAVFDDLSEEKLFIYPHKIEWVDGKIPVAHKARYYIPKIDKKEPLKEELEHFVECVVDRKTPKTDGYEALRVLNVLEKAEKSIRGGLT